MNTYTVNVHIGTVLQLTLTAEDEDEAELLGCEKAKEIILDKDNAESLQKNISPIEAEVIYKIEGAELKGIHEFIEEKNEN